MQSLKCEGNQTVKRVECPYRVHGLLCLQSFSMFDSLHFLLVLPQHPATKIDQF